MTNTFEPADRSQGHGRPFARIDNTSFVGVNGIRATDRVGVQTEQFSVPDIEAYFIIPFSLPGFDPAVTGGHLRAIKLLMSLDCQLGNECEELSPDGDPSLYSGTIYIGTWSIAPPSDANALPSKLGTKIYLNSQAATWGLQAELYHTFPNSQHDVTLFDGTFDYAGTSGFSYAPLAQEPLQLVNTITDPAVLASWQEHNPCVMAFQKFNQNPIRLIGGLIHHEFVEVTAQLVAQYIFTY